MNDDDLLKRLRRQYDLEFDGIVVHDLGSTRMRLGAKSKVANGLCANSNSDASSVLQGRALSCVEHVGELWPTRRCS